MKIYIKLITILTGLSLTYSAFADVIHKVQPGDTLKSLSQTYYGDSTKGQVIYNKNKTQIPAAQTLKVGQKLIIPVEKKMEESTESTKIQRTEEGLPLLIDLSSTEPPDPWCCCVDGLSPENANNNADESGSDEN